MAVVDCRFFNGYKPCGKNHPCTQDCPSKEILKESLLVIHLGALGSVVRSSALLRKLKQAHPQAAITWLTSEAVLPILEKHPAIDKLYALNFVNFLKLQGMSFDKTFVIDKSLEAVSVAAQIKTKEIKGFVAHPLQGAILPANPEAQELWELGIDNHKKFFVNQKTELQLIFESLGYAYQNEKYWLDLSPKEKQQSLVRRQNWLKLHSKKQIIGINTGCSQVIAYKKLSLEKHRELIKKIHSEFFSAQIVLLGGREDEERNQLLAQEFPTLIASSTQEGLRDGIISVEACDIVVSGDSLGMHIAIALEKYTVAWFGPTCAHEIDLFGKGVKIQTYLNCHPCWKRTCSQEKMCYDHVHIEEFIAAIRQGLRNIENDRTQHTNTLTKENSDSSHCFFG